jgi:Right handed beta helix region
MSGGRARLPWMLVCALASSLVLLAGTGSAWAATYRAGDGASLMEAVGSANGGTGPNTIELGAGTFLPTSTLTITGNVAMVGPATGPPAKLEGTAVAPFPSDLLVIEGHGKLSLSNVEVTRGGGEGAAALDDYGQLELESSTVGGNGGPGLLVQPQASATVRDSTFAAGGDGGVADSGGSVSLLNDTIARNNGAGVENHGTVNLTNTIVAENTGGDCVGRASSSDASLDSDRSCGVGALSGLNPLLGALAANGGSTLTMALGAGSPAIGAGDPAKCPAEDQRHYVRPAGRCDLGAYQTSASPSGSSGAPGGSGAGSGSGSGSSSAGGGGARGVRESVIAHGVLRGARRSRITFSLQAVAGESHAKFLYSDGSRRVALRALTLRSLAINWRRGIATIRGSGVEVHHKQGVSVTLVLVDHGKTRSLSIRLSRAYYKSGRLLDGSIRFTRPS